MTKNMKLHAIINNHLTDEEWDSVFQKAMNNPDTEYRHQILRLLKRLKKTSWDNLGIGEKIFLHIYFQPKIFNDKNIEELALPLFMSFTGRDLSAIKAAVDQVACAYNITKSTGNGLMSSPRLLMILEKTNPEIFQSLVLHFAGQRDKIITSQGGKPVLQVFTDVDDTCYQSKLGGCDAAYHHKPDKTLYDDWTQFHQLVRQDDIVKLFGCSRTENTLTLVSALPMTPLKPYKSTMRDIINKAKDQAMSAFIESPVKDISQMRAIPPPYTLMDIIRLKGSFPKILKFIFKRFILSHSVLRLVYFAISKMTYKVTRSQEYHPSFYEWVNEVGNSTVWDEFFHGKNQVLKACSLAYPEKEFIFLGDCGQADHRVGEELLKMRPNSKVFIHNIKYNHNVMGQPQYYHWDKIQKDTVYNSTYTV